MGGQEGGKVQGLEDMRIIGTTAGSFSNTCSTTCPTTCLVCRARQQGGRTWRAGASPSWARLRWVDEVEVKGGVGVRRGWRCAGEVEAEVGGGGKVAMEMEVTCC